MSEQYLAEQLEMERRLSEERIRTLEAELSVARNQRDSWMAEANRHSQERANALKEVARLGEENERHTRNHADCTGHLHTCAKVNGVWQCATGCAQARVRELEESADRVKAAWDEDMARLADAQAEIERLREAVKRAEKEFAIMGWEWESGE